MVGRPPGRGMTWRAIEVHLLRRPADGTARYFQACVRSLAMDWTHRRIRRTASWRDILTVFFHVVAEGKEDAGNAVEATSDVGRPATRRPPGGHAACLVSRGTWPTPPDRDGCVLCDASTGCTPDGQRSLSITAVRRMGQPEGWTRGWSLLVRPVTVG